MTVYYKPGEAHLILWPFSAFVTTHVIASSNHLHTNHIL